MSDKQKAILIKGLLFFLALAFVVYVTASNSPELNKSNDSLDIEQESKI